MNDAKYKWLLNAIAIVIISTIAIQIYWNFKNYQINKQQLINDVQTSLDNAVETYYADLAEKSTIGFAIEANSTAEIFEKNGRFDSIMQIIDIAEKGFQNIDSVQIDLNNQPDGIKIFKGYKADSLLQTIHSDHNVFKPQKDKFELKHIELNQSDSTTIDDLKILTSKVVFSMSQDTLNLNTLDTLLVKQLNRKSLELDYILSFKKVNGDTLLSKDSALKTTNLNTVSKSPFLPKESELTIYFSNETKVILKRILTGIVLSSLLVLAVIACLFYLLKIIKHQKQLAEVKNDLISNITHEFKTPIATIGVALESINSFNVIEDKEKTKQYIDTSSNQLQKLNLMVEKLLETATLDSEALEINTEDIDLILLLQSLIKKHSISLTDKTIELNSTLNSLLINVDAFHIENALNNIIDNALKYGGDKIVIDVSKQNNQVTINVSDNGTSLTKTSKEKIFEKFYRVPKGNTHDVKGFGIGLYYTRKIIEKHKGSIILELEKDMTNFKITLPES
ncbi:sensor histidine kinase [Pontimicrobium sp. IMCC45349]|uniref:sensor histidine kinase n=1 Tax=Pontimicrobium sp. IMCC45349 TaxID=3391574 RepID=UPI0039A16D63